MVIIRILTSILASFVGLIVLLPFLVLLLPFTFVALIIRVINRFSYIFKPDPVGWQKLIEYEPIVGWKPKRNLNTFASANNVFQLTTDANGWRGKSSLSDCQIVVIGDSFAFGYGMDDDNYFADINPDLKIKAIGVNGYNMVQEIIWMEKLSEYLVGKLVVWFIYYGNDLYENLQPNLGHYRMPFVRNVNGVQDWEVVTSHVSSEKWPSFSRRKYYDKLAEICSPTYFSERAFSACEYLIRRGRDICSNAGAELVIMTIADISQISHSQIERLAKLAPDPKTFDPDIPDNKIEEICRGLDVKFIALKDHLKEEDYMELDVHWNKKGHKKVADLLSTLYQEKR